MLSTLILLSTLFAQPSGQVEPDPKLHSAVATGKSRYESVDFRGAQRAFSRAIALPGVPSDQRLLALAYLGRVYGALGENAAAEQVFSVLLLIDPKFTLSADTSPRIRETLERARHSFDAPHLPRVAKRRNGRRRR